VGEGQGHRGWRRALRIGAALATTGVAGLFVLQVAQRAHLRRRPRRRSLRPPRRLLTQIGHQSRCGGGRRIAYGYWVAAPPPERIVRATLALEDRRFWRHPGIDPIAVARALWQDLAGGSRRSGASTIAMQVARMQHPGPRTLWAKAVEAATALVPTGRYGGRADRALSAAAPYGTTATGSRMPPAGTSTSRWPI
jgi:penicillin-binding protein 1C